MSENKSNSNGIGFFGLLTIVFIVLKLIDVISWPWWQVLAPAWGSVLFVLICFFIAVAIHMWINKH